MQPPLHRIKGRMIQISLFDGTQPLKITKPIRLIELFAGIGAQAKALENLGVNFETYRVCEFDKYAIKSYNAIHGTNFETSDIRELHGDDLGIVDTDKYEYIITYSFPCQDLSLAGNQKGMTKGTGTRSGLLWEVERLLNETENKPQILLMENVPQVIGEKNIKDFAKWLDALEKMGYCNYWQVLNAKDYGIPQNRARCFMVSVLGDYYYDFPTTIKLTKRPKDLLETSVDEKYYLSDKAINGVMSTSFNNAQFENRTEKNGIIPTLLARDYKDPKLVCEPKCEMVGMLMGEKWEKMHDQSRRVYGYNGLAPTLHTCGGGNLEPKIQVCGNYSPSGHNATRIVDPNQYLRQDGCVGTLTTDGSSPKHNNRIVEPIVIGGIGEKKSNGGTQWYQQDRIYDGDCAISIATGFNPYYEVEPSIKDYRIRKLTPRECFRLMGVKDEDFDKVAKHQSNSSLYHLAGDSIVTNVLSAIFKQMGA